MLSKYVISFCAAALLAIAGGVWAHGSIASNADCCTVGAACCPSGPCCVVAKPSDCCGAGQDCCFPGSECCTR